MYIKQITLSNFRSFYTQPELQPAFSAHTNAVVGRNGSGKSNLFDAVQFVLLAPRFANLRQEERQALLHEGTGSAAVTAFVEIVLDNADGRFSMEASDEVTLRRTIGLKKDEFFLNRKRVTKQEVQSILEGAGFSKSNPYFIVQQGKIQDLCTMSDKDRLLLLKEVAGTTVYDEKKAESLAKMQENTASIEKIQEILSEIQQRLADLQEEKEELSQYQQLDRQRRALEYTLYDKELRKTRTVLDGLEHDRAEHVTVVSDLHASAKQTHDAIQSVEDILKTKSNVLRRHKVSLQNYEDDARGAITRVAKLELQRKEGASSLKSLQEQANQNQKDLQQVEREIKQTQKLLDTDVQPAYDKAVEELNQLQDARQDNKRQLDSLLAKQGRAKQFSSKADRDAFLKESIQDLQTSQNCKQEQLQQEQTSLANTRRSMVAETRELEQTSQKVTSMTGKLHALTKNIDDSKKQRLDLIQRRKEYQRQKEDLQEQVREAREQYHRALSNVRKVMPKATAMGMEALKSVVEQEGLTSNEYFGMVMDNFTLTNENYQVAVEVAAQNSLFHVIVDTDQTAARLMKRLEDGKLGRVTFLPLNQLVVDNTVQYPDHNDVRPMLELCLNFDPKVERAMKHVFAKKLLARNPQVASEWSAKLKMDAITLEGDLCSRKGALTGGYVDVNKSRLRAHDERNKAHEALRVIEREYQTLNQQVQRSDQEATNVMSELQRLESKHADLSHRLSETESTVARLTVRQETQKKQCEKLEKETIPIIEKEVASLQADIDRLDEEIGTELVETLSAADRRIVQDLKQDQVQLGPKIEMQTDIVAKAGVERQKLLSLLNDNLLKRRRELTEGGIATTTTDEDDEDDDSSGHRTSFSRFSSVTLLQDQLQADLNQHNRDLDEAIRIKEDLESRVERAREEVQILQEELVKAKNQLEQLKGEDTQNRLDLEEAHDKAERLLNKRSMCVSKRETYTRKIAELGSLPPPSELERFTNKSIHDLMKSLDSVNKQLKKYSHVNKKAFDQYVNFNEQREQLLARKEELDKEAEKVNELIESLDQQKDEAINRTFRGASSHFKDVFSELVPNGAGELTMRTAIDDDDDDEEEDDDDAQSPKKKTKTISDPSNPDVSLYRGIGIKVRFSQVGENYIMSQLSGGQKALVAMALIFAIQRCDPAPFYLFDELDQALDSTYRAAVARMIKKQANNKENPTQFIVSTFRPELVEAANQCYGISLQNKVSSVHALPKKDALRFIADLMHDEEAVGEVTTVATSKGSTLGARKRKAVAQVEYNDDSEGGDGLEVEYDDQ